MDKNLKIAREHLAAALRSEKLEKLVREATGGLLPPPGTPDHALWHVERAEAFLKLWRESRGPQG